MNRKAIHNVDPSSRIKLTTIREGMTSLVEDIRALQQSPVKHVVEQRLQAFAALSVARPHILFTELCFCILAANFSGKRAWEIQRAIDQDFLSLDESGLSQRLRELGYRFPNVRARHIVAARCFVPLLPGIVASHNSRAARDWTAATIPGLGLKEASHFLRNTGTRDVAIVDVHVMRLLERHGLLTTPKTLTPRRYHDIERRLDTLAAECGLSLAALDLYLWCLATGTVLK